MSEGACLSMQVLRFLTDEFGSSVSFSLAEVSSSATASTVPCLALLGDLTFLCGNLSLASWIVYYLIRSASILASRSLTTFSLWVLPAGG